MYGVEVHESRNVSSRGYAFAKPIDKRYLAGTDGGGGDADGGSKEDRKLPSKGKDGDRERDGSCGWSRWSNERGKSRPQPRKPTGGPPFDFYLGTTAS